MSALHDLSERKISSRMEYRERTYRHNILKNNLTSFHVSVRETDLFISSDRDLTKVALHSVFRYRKFIETYIACHPLFLTSLNPIRRDDLAPPIIRDMLEASRTADVGPMAAVAGAIAQYVGCDLIEETRNVIVENGGDIFLNSENEVRVGIFAGESPLSYKVALKIKPEEMPLGICTSSGTVGHSLSFGSADAVCVSSRSAPLADAAATSICNLVKGERDIKKALEAGAKINGVLGIVIILNDKLGACGAVELV